MHDPIRLRHDPAQPAAMRSAIQAEIAAPMGGDLAALKASLGQQIASGASGSVLGVGPKLVLLLGLGALGAWWLQTGPTTPAAPIAVAAEAPKPPAELHALVAVPVQPLAMPPEPPSLEVEAPTAALLQPEQAPAPRPTLRARRPAPIPEAPKPSGLAAEMAAYQSAQNALSAGHYLPAAAHFADYLKTYPEGSLVDEATLGQLEALHHAKQPAKVVALAQSILNTERIPERHAEVLRVVAEAEVMRGHCESAKKAFAQAKDKGADVTASDLQGALQTCESRAMR